MTVWQSWIWQKSTNADKFRAADNLSFSKQQTRPFKAHRKIPTISEALLNKFLAVQGLGSSSFASRVARGKSRLGLIVTAKFVLPGEKTERSEEAACLCALKAPGESAYRWSKHDQITQTTTSSQHLCCKLHITKPGRKYSKSPYRYGAYSEFILTLWWNYSGKSWMDTWLSFSCCLTGVWEDKE